MSNWKEVVDVWRAEGLRWPMGAADRADGTTNPQNLRMFYYCRSVH